MFQHFKLIIYMENIIKAETVSIENSPGVTVKASLFLHEEVLIFMVDAMKLKV